VLVIGLGLLWFYNQPPDLEKIYNQNFEAYPNVVAPTVRDVSTSENDVQKAFSYYDNHNYKEAVKAFETLDTEDAHFYLAMSLMADYQTEKAVEVMKNNDLQSSETYKNQTDWYLALAYLKMNDKNMAIDYLNKVIKSYPSKTEEAQKIISKIR
jgi:tetratricopeptide (TPR) repeat protein